MSVKIRPTPGVDPSALAAVADVMEHGGKLSLAGESGARVELPDSVVEVLREVVAALVQGRPINGASIGTLLSTQEAAALLGVSRPTLVRLLEAGEIEFERPGGHRRVPLAALVEYQGRIRRTRRATLDEMARDAAQNDGYEQVRGFVQTR